MTTDLPTCPADYTCHFVRVQPRVVYQHPGPWWQHSGGLAVALVGAVALACVIAYVAYLYSEARTRKWEAVQAEKKRQHELDLQEQRTMQIDAAKGNPEMLKLVQQLQRR